MAYEYPKYKRREVNKYVRKYSDIENCISYDVMKYMMGNAHLYPTLEMADNALSRYIAQKGKCAVTHNALSITDMVCMHIQLSGHFPKRIYRKTGQRKMPCSMKCHQKRQPPFSVRKTGHWYLGSKRKQKRSRRKKKMENLKLINETDLKYFRELEKQGKAVILKIDPEVLLNTEIRPKEKPSWDGLEKWLTEIGKSLP